MTRETDSDHEQKVIAELADRKTIDGLTDQSEKLMADLGRMNAELAGMYEEKRQLLAALDVQNIRLNSLERAFAVASGAVEVPPLTVSIRDSE